MSPSRRHLAEGIWWRAEFARLRSRRPCRWSWLMSPRVILLPKWASWLSHVYAVAFVVGPCVCVLPSLRRAPRAVRRFWLGHEWGHVVAGHVLHDYALAVAMIGLVVAYTGVVSNGLGWGKLPGGPRLMWLGLLSAIGVFWSRGPSLLPRWLLEVEKEADGVAADVYGAKAGIDALEWIVANLRGGRWDARSHERRRALQLRLFTEAGAIDQDTRRR